MRGCWEAGPLAELIQPAAVRIERAPAIRPDHETAATTGRLDFIPVGPASRIRPRRAVRPRKGAAARSPDPVVGFWGEEP